MTRTLTSEPSRPLPPAPDGYVTLAVLLMSALLAAVVGGVMAVAKPALGLTRIGADQLATGGLADGAVRAAAFLLLGGDQPPEKVDGLTLHLQGGEARLGAADEAGRIDLNAADPQLLEGLFVAVEGKSMTGQAFAARVVDWRDDDEDETNDGAEAAGYSDAGLSYVPPDRPFHSVEELKFLLELSAEDFAKLRPYLTVYSGAAGIDPMSAPRAVLRAIPHVSDSDLDRFLQARGKGTSREQLVNLLPDAEDFFLTEKSGVYRVTVHARLDNGFADAIEAVITSRSAEDSAGFKVVAWSELPPESRPH